MQVSDGVREEVFSSSPSNCCVDLGASMLILEGNSKELTGDVATHIAFVP